MFGIIYIVLSLLAGKELAEILLFTGKNAQEAGSRNGQHKAFCNQIWVLAAATFGMGTLVFGWTTYMISWAASEAGAKKPLIYGNTAVLIITAVVLVLLYWKRYRKTGTVWTVADRKLISDSRAFRKECILFGFLLVFLTWIMFYVFYIRNGELYSGFSVYGDYAPHTAMMRSFSKGNNFPTEYPHFGGQDVKYHFMFQFLVGNLEFLGIRLDFAYNIESVLALLGFLMLLYSIAKRLTASLAAGILTLVLFFFRSSLSFFHFVTEHLQAKDLWATLRDNTTFIGYTTNENWGLWNFNVYLNQRHLAFGLLIVSLVIWLFMDWLDIGCAEEEKGIVWLRNRFFTKKAWKCICPENALMAGMFLGLTSFWNGAAVIGGLLILLGVLLGRFICGFLCPFGWLQELLHKIPSPKCSTKRLKPLRYLKYAVLLIMVVLLPALVVNEMGMGDPFFCKYLCPQGVLEGAIPLSLTNAGIRAALGKLFSWKLCILLAVVVASVVFYRPFCKWLCPLGAFYAVMNRVSLFQMRVDTDKCVSCGACARAC